MKKLLLSTVALLLYFHIGSAKDTTIVLQNGLDGYTGCIDAYVYDGYYNESLDSVNYKDEKDLIIFWGNNGLR